MNTRKLTILSIAFTFWLASDYISPILALTTPLSCIILALLIPHQISLREALALKAIMNLIILLLRPDVTQILDSMWNAAAPSEIAIPEAVLQIISPIYSFSILFVTQLFQILTFNKALKNYLVMT